MATRLDGMIQATGPHSTLHGDYTRPYGIRQYVTIPGDLTKHDSTKLDGATGRDTTGQNQTRRHDVTVQYYTLHYVATRRNETEQDMATIYHET